MAEDDSYDLAPGGAENARLAPMNVVRAAGTEEGETNVEKKAVLRACPYCGHELRGTPKARCPECSAPMDESARELLQFSDVGWVRGTAGALFLLVAAMPLHVIGAALGWGGAVAARRAGVTPHILGTVLVVVVILKITKREPVVTGLPARKEEGSRALARLARGAAIGALVIWGILAADAWMGLGFPWAARKPLILLVLICQGMTAVFAGQLGQALAMRIPDDGLASHTALCGWLVGIVCAALFGLRFLDMTTAIHMMFFTCSFLMIAGMLAILVWAMITLVRLGGTMRISAGMGEEITAKRLARMAGRRMETH